MLIMVVKKVPDRRHGLCVYVGCSEPGQPLSNDKVQATKAQLNVRNMRLLPSQID